jgi:hypothetical protein
MAAQSIERIGGERMESMTSLRWDLADEQRSVRYLTWVGAR